MRSFFLASLFSIFLLLGTAPLKAQLTSEQASVARLEGQRQAEEAHKIKRKILEEHRLKQKPAPKKWTEKFDFHYAVREGYGQNVPVHPDRFKDSLYTKQEAAIGYMDHIKNVFIYRLSYDLLHTLYYKFAELNILEQHFNAETALKLRHNLFLELGYRLILFRRQHTPFSDYNANNVKIGLKHYLIKDKLYHKPSWLFHHHGYGKFKARDAEGNSTLQDRKDNLNAFDYEIGWYFHHRLLIRLHNQFGRNDSNDQFLDFHDYSYYAVTPIVSWHLTKKWLLSGGFHYQFNHYDDRSVHGSPERAHLYSFFGGIYYQINKNLTWSANAVYVQNNSNVPELEYKDPVYSTGFHLHF